MSIPISDAEMQFMANAIFDESPSMVIEAYSGFGQDARMFSSAQELCIYAANRRNYREPSVHIAVHYPDMAGRVVSTRVALDPVKCGGHLYRHRADGWGLIQVYLQLGSTLPHSFVSANSEKRANAWATTFPELDSPSQWTWPAVARHLRRLRRALKHSM